MQVQVAKNPSEWNAIVDRSPFSFLHHKYEACVYEDKTIPLLIEDRNRHFLFPLRITNFLKGFRLAASQVYYYASILPDTEKNLDSIPEALDCMIDFLQKIGVNYLLTCAPTFFSQRYAALSNTWFKKHNASVQIIYVHMIRTKNATFEEIWKHRFKKNARPKIRKAEREGVKILKIDSSDAICRWINDIYQCNLSALRRQGREGAYPDSYKDALQSELLSTKKHLGEFFNLYGAIYRERLIAYMIIREYNRIMQVNKAMSHTKFLDKCPNDALMAYLLKDACDRGFDWFEYGFERVRRGGKIPTLYPELQMFKFKFGFEEVPMFIYRLGLTHGGRMIQQLYSGREYFIARAACIPKSVREVPLKLFARWHRKFSVFSEL